MKRQMCSMGQDQVCGVGVEGRGIESVLGSDWLRRGLGHTVQVRARG